MVKKFLIIIGVLTISLVAGHILAEWQGPAQAPPGGNVSAPIHVGSEGQAKLGTIASAGFLGHVPGYGIYPDPGGSSVIGGSLTLKGSSSYLKLPLLSESQRDELSPESGMMIYNTTANEVQAYLSGQWMALARGVEVGQECEVSSECLTGYCYADVDGDGYHGETGQKHCQATASLGLDCDENDMNVFQLVEVVMDQDGDGWSFGNSWVQCLGDGQVAGDLVRHTTDGVNYDLVTVDSRYGTDCCDIDARAKPGQASYFAENNNCSSWDYNCNGTADRQSATCDRITGCVVSGVDRACCSGCSTVDATGISKYYSCGATQNGRCAYQAYDQSCEAGPWKYITYIYGVTHSYGVVAGTVYLQAGDFGSRCACR